MKQTVTFAAVVALMWAGSSAAQAPKTDDEKALYVLGYSLGDDVQGAFGPLSKEEMALIRKGLEDAWADKKPAADPETYGPKLQNIAKSRSEKRNAEYLAKAEKEKGAQKTASGLIYISQKEGKGASPGTSDTVKVHYRGTLPDGTEFDSSYTRNQPAEFPLNQVIACWTEGVQKMKPGGKAKLVCPGKIAYGERPPPGSRIPPNATLTFEIELLEVKGK